MTRRRRRAALLVAGGLAVAACSSSSHSKAPTPTTTAAAGAHVLLVGFYHGHAGAYQTIQAAVDAATPGDWVLIGPGDYHEQYDHTAAVGPEASAGVYITTPSVHVRGMDRNAVIVDGTKPGSPPCSTAAADQDPGPLNGAGKPAGRNGIEVWKADGTSVDNLTACNFLTGADGGGNEIWWNGGDGSGTVGMGAYNGSYLNASTTYAAGATNGSYGIFVSNAGGPGLIAHSYASNMSDAGFYIGACADCNVTLDDAHAQYSSLGYSGTVVDNRFVDNASWAVSVVPYPDTGTPPPVAHCVGGDPNGYPALGIKGCYYAAWGNEVAHNTFSGNGSYGNPTNGDLADLSDSHDPGNCWHDNTDPAGITSTPANLQQTNGTCGAPGAGAGITSPLLAQLLCASELLAPCPPKPGMSYPRQTAVVLPALAPQTTMPNPCAGVPANPWCSTGRPVGSSLWLPALLGALGFPTGRARGRRTSLVGRRP